MVWDRINSSKREKGRGMMSGFILKCYRTIWHRDRINSSKREKGRWMMSLSWVIRVGDKSFRGYDG